MMRSLVPIVVLCGVVLAGPAAATEPRHRIGLGVHYWRTLEDIAFSEADENGIAWVITYQHKLAAMLRVELDLELLPDAYAAADGLWAPEALIILGSGVYAGLGVGTYVSSGHWGEDPFFMLRVGFDAEVLPMLYLDINANYRFEEWDDITEVDEEIDHARRRTAAGVLRLRLRRSPCSDAKLPLRGISYFACAAGALWRVPVLAGQLAAAPKARPSTRYRRRRSPPSIRRCT